MPIVIVNFVESLYGRRIAKTNLWTRSGSEARQKSVSPARWRLQFRCLSIHLPTELVPVGTICSLYEHRGVRGGFGPFCCWSRLQNKDEPRLAQMDYSSNKKLLETSASLLVTSALLVVTMFAIGNKNSHTLKQRRSTRLLHPSTTAGSLEAHAIGRSLGFKRFGRKWRIHSIHLRQSKLF